MKKNKFTIISLFDGMSCGQIAINRLIKRSMYNWLASEIDKGAMGITQFNFPDTIQLGDVTKLDKKGIKKLVDQVFMVMGGSPCTDVSIAGNRKGMVTKENIRITSLKQYLQLKKDGFEFHGESYLFWEFVRVVKETKPKYFFLENVLMKGKNKFWEDVISKELGVQPIRVNSSTMSIQNRERLYWTNIPNITVPEDRNINVPDVIEDAVTGYGFRGVKLKKTDKNYTRKGTARIDNKLNCLTKSSGCRYVKLSSGEVRPLTLEECEVAQTVPVGYVSNVPNVRKSDKFTALGNGWTVDVIEHMFSFIPEFK
jgi:DNA (cytosine-5)-methyltransferase 3A